VRSGGVDQSVPSDEGTKWEDLTSELEEKLSYLYSHIERNLDAYIENAPGRLWKNSLEEIYKRCQKYKKKVFFIYGIICFYMKR